MVPQGANPKSPRNLIFKENLENKLFLKFLGGRLQNMGLPQVQRIKVHFIPFINERNCLNDLLWLTNLVTTSSKQIFCNSQFPKLEEAFPEFVSSLKSGALQTKKLHWTFEDIVFDSNYSLKFITTSKEAETTIENAINKTENLLNLSQRWIISRPQPPPNMRVSVRG